MISFECRNGIVKFSWIQSDSIRFDSMEMNKKPFPRQNEWIIKTCWLEPIQMLHSSSLNFISFEKSSTFYSHWFDACYSLYLFDFWFTSISMIKTGMHFVLRIWANANQMENHQYECLHFINKNHARTFEKSNPWNCDWRCDEKNK